MVQVPHRLEESGKVSPRLPAAEDESFVRHRRLINEGLSVDLEGHEREATRRDLVVFLPPRRVAVVEKDSMGTAQEFPDRPRFRSPVWASRDGEENVQKNHPRPVEGHELFQEDQQKGVVQAAVQQDEVVPERADEGL